MPASLDTLDLLAATPTWNACGTARTLCAVRTALESQPADSEVQPAVPVPVYNGGHVRQHGLPLERRGQHVRDGLCAVPIGLDVFCKLQLRMGPRTYLQHRSFATATMRRQRYLAG